MTHAIANPATLGALPPHYAAAISFLARYSGETFTNYQGALNRFLTWCETNQLDPLQQVTRGHIELYVRHLGESLKPSSVCTLMNPVRGYYKYAYIDGLIGHDPAAYARLPKVWHSKKSPVDRQDVRRFLAAAKATSPRHWALTQMLAIMGMRISEACSITVEQALHVEQGLRVLHYVGKGSKPAVTPIPYQSIAAIDAAIAGRTTGRLITTKDGRPLTRHGAASLIETVNRRAGLDVHLNPHYLRALAATQAREAGLTLDEAQLLLRHEDPRTTKRHYDLTVIDAASHPVHTIGARLAV